MSFVKSKGFKYLKNLLIGVGAAVVLVGALFKLESWPYASEMLVLGLGTEALIFLVLGILGPEKRLLLGKIISRFRPIWCKNSTFSCWTRCFYSRIKRRGC